MSDGVKIPYNEAKAVADYLVKRLGHVCQRIEIAGSLRRKKAMVGDIELVLIPQTTQGLFGEPIYDTPLIEYVLAGATAHYRFIKTGNWYKQVVLDNKYTVDLFITTPEKWGCIFAIRTGSADFTKRLVTPKKHGGLCPSNLKFHEGRIWNIPPRTPEEEEVRLFFDGLIKEDYLSPLDTPEEIDVFNACGIDFIAPELRLA